eukprot:TRINITY_DN4418_c0_g2_i1.p1 TRINITY_DN4418_c0_g2~~TRINITY_DN4418_c0_g2_i1.p1  ORF type:complete len:900 (-),score=175.30 TRINITY_DN4418_c0_g2_i1:42-2741(-)
MEEQVGKRRNSTRRSLSQGQPRRSSRISDSKRRSTPPRSQAGLLENLGIGHAANVEKSQESEGSLSWRKPHSALGVLWHHLKRRLRKLGRQCRRALRKEWRTCCGQSNTCEALNYLYRNHPDAVRQSLWENLKGMMDTMLGRSHTTMGGAPKPPGLKKARRAAVRLAGKKTDGNKPGFGIHCFIINNPGTITDFYYLHEQIGAGGSAKVYKASELGTKVVRAVKKIYKRSSADLARYVMEMAIMKTLDHPNIIKLYETFEDDDAIYLVLEFCEGGDVLDKLVTSGILDENQTAVVVRGVLAVLNYLNANGYVHRDIKPENILFKESRNDQLLSQLRIVDFGYSCKAPEEGFFLHTKVGTPYYVAPEVLSGQYGKECDVWSCGVVAYMLLAGYPPFFGETDADTIRSVVQGKFMFHANQWEDLSKSCKHFIKRLLEVDVSNRMSIPEALEHPWLKHKARGRVDMLREETVERLVQFSRYHALKRSALLALAYHVEADDVKPLMELFRGMDLNGDGLLTRDEFIKAVKACGVEGDLIADMMLSVDADHSGIIDYTEFLAATLERYMFVDDHGVVLRAFRSFDQDDSGELTAEEIAETIDMTGPENLEEIERIFAEVDKNGDGVMDYGEFFDMVSNQAGLSGIIPAVEDDEADRQEETTANGQKAERPDAGEEPPGSPKAGSPKEETKLERSASKTVKLEPPGSPKAGSPKAGTQLERSASKSVKLEPPGSPKAGSFKEGTQLERSASKAVKFGSDEEEDEDKGDGKAAEHQSPKSARGVESEAADAATAASARGPKSTRRKSVHQSAELGDGAKSARSQQAAEEPNSARTKTQDSARGGQPAAAKSADDGFTSGSADHLSPTEGAAASQENDDIDDEIHRRRRRRQVNAHATEDSSSESES